MLMPAMLPCAMRRERAFDAADMLLREAAHAAVICVFRPAYAMLYARGDVTTGALPLMPSRYVDVDATVAAHSAARVATSVQYARHMKDIVARRRCLRYAARALLKASRDAHAQEDVTITAFAARRSSRSSTYARAPKAVQARKRYDKDRCRAEVRSQRGMR